MKSSKIKNICIVILSIILFVYLVLFVNSLMKNEKVGFFNIRFYIMPADSVEMDLYEGDLVIARTIKPDKVKENDKVLYRKDNIIGVNSVSSVENKNGNVSISVKGNKSTGNDNIDNAQIIGKVTGKIRRMGNVAMFIQSPLGTMNVILLVACVIIIIRKISKKTEKNANEEKWN